MIAHDVWGTYERIPKHIEILALQAAYTAAINWPENLSCVSNWMRAPDNHSYNEWIDPNTINSRYSISDRLQLG
jgi:type II secretory pathway pseudopilin PulG